MTLGECGARGYRGTCALAVGHREPHADRIGGTFHAIADQCEDTIPVGTHERQCWRSAGHDGDHAIGHHRTPRAAPNELDPDVRDLLDRATANRYHEDMWPVVVTVSRQVVVLAPGSTRTDAERRVRDDGWEMNLDEADVLPDSWSYEVDSVRDEPGTLADAWYALGVDRYGPRTRCPECRRTGSLTRISHDPLLRCHGIWIIGPRGGRRRLRTG